MPKLNLTPSDDVREWLEFYGTAAARLGERLAECEAALAKGQFGPAIHSLKSARVTHSILSKGITQAAEELSQEARR